MIDRAAFLKRTDLLAQLPLDTLEHIGGCMEEIKATRGMVIFQGGEIGDAVYFVVEGVLEIVKNGTILLTMPPSECVGEFALIDEGPRSASVVAKTDVILLKWRREDFQHALAGNPKLVNGIIRILTKKLRQDISRQLEASLQQERLEQDLKRAHEIQMAMLPEADFSTECIDISGYCRPATFIGGDYFDYLPLKDKKLGIFLADVMGHGFYSGLFVAMAKVSLHTQSNIDFSPNAVMGAMNRTVFYSVRSEMLMSSCYIILDPSNKKLTYTNAGHPYPYHYRSSIDSLERLPSTDLLLGIPGFEEAPFSSNEMNWDKGDILVLFSDGVSEAKNSRQENFKEQRLERIVLQNKHKSSSQVKDAILEALSNHSQRVPQGDDITLVVAKAL
jgi:sigma-B regulation protein RsbU (phosphoserine phosphatase)